MPDEAEDAQAALNAVRGRKRRAALGPPLTQIDADLTTLAEVGPHDIATVEAFVRDSAGETGVALFRAEREG
jgi:hypothetical protein